MSRKIADMDPEVRGDATKLDQAFTDAGIVHVIMETLRTLAVQQAYFAQGRLDLEAVAEMRDLAGLPALYGVDPLIYAKSPGKYIITKCDGVKVASIHQSGRAIDIALADLNGDPLWNYDAYAHLYRQMGDIAGSLGWGCGMDWPPFDQAGLGWDVDHFEHPSLSGLTMREQTG